MQYQEINLFNTAFVPPFVQKRPVSLYAREDIIDTEKITLACSSRVEWKLVEYQDHMYFQAWIPLQNRVTRLKHGVVQQLGVYVMTDMPTMFETARNGHIMDWLGHYWNKMFLMTTPIMKYIPSFSLQRMDIHMDYFVPNIFPLRKHLLLDHSIHTTWIEMLDARSYTLGNGLTLFLTLLKAGIIPKVPAKACIQHLFHRYGVDLFQPVGDRWMGLYYGHPIMHVCDNPYFYCAMGDPCVPFDIFQMFMPHDDDVIMNVAHGNHRIISTLRSVILTHFRPEWWRKVLGTAWYECPLDINAEDEYAPNVASFFLSMTRTKGSWQWWLENKEEYLESLNDLLSKYHSPVRLLENLLQPVLHFYENAEEYSPTLCYSRLRSLWKQLLQRFDPNCEHIIQIIQRWSLRITFVHILKTRGYISQPGWEFEPPVAFLKDVVDMYGEKCQLYRNMSLRIYSEYDRLILRTYPELQYDTALRSNFNTIKVLQMAPAHTTFSIFYHKILKVRIQSRLLAIYRGFGMLENRTSTVPQWRRMSGLHTIGFLVLEHVREHKDLLYV